MLLKLYNTRNNKSTAFLTLNNFCDIIKYNHIPTCTEDIMKAIMQKAGVDSKAHALVFSLPVSETAGFRFADTVDKE